MGITDGNRLFHKWHLYIKDTIARKAWEKSNY